MADQMPTVLGAQPGLTLDLTSPDLIVFLQPTRIIRRKRIHKNLVLISNLLSRSRLKKAFLDNPNRKLLLHITGPVPKEHQKDLEQIISAYSKTNKRLPDSLTDRVFLSFSVGQHDHSSFDSLELSPLTIEEIYRIADLVVFPSETEGRGLPIIEACASGKPIICSRYRPEKVFSDVVGERLPNQQRIVYFQFPERRYKKKFLSEVAGFLLDPREQENTIDHNREAVRIRYSQESFSRKIVDLVLQVVKEL
jgi:glycosyltransferase involved in cell wall biosynthesis